MKKLLVFIMVILLPTGALAQPLDPDDNSIGIYFDTGATENTWSGVGLFDYYLVLVNPTMNWVRGAALDLHTEVSDEAPGYAVPFGQTSFQPFAPGNLVTSGDYLGIFYAAPRAASETMVLLQSTGQWFVEGVGYVHFWVSPATAGVNPGQISILEEGGAILSGVDPANGDICAWISSGPDVIANEQTTFGGVKALYR